VIMSKFTGSEFFPGGLGTFEAPRNQFLVFEQGPSVDITLQWAKYFDAADETSLSRIYGGIHPTADDIPGRFIGAEIGADAFRFASSLYGINSNATRASFKVSKHFTDGNNLAEVTVAISCNTGLILDQNKRLSDGEAVEFVVTGFTEGNLSCSVTEVDAAAYVAEYNNIPRAIINDSACEYQQVLNGDQYECAISNSPAAVNVVISKDWIFTSSSAADIDTGYTLTLYCDAPIEGGYSAGNQAVAGPACPRAEPAESGQGDGGIFDWCKAFNGDGAATFSARVIPEFPGSTCYVLETGQDATVLADQSDCTDMMIRAGQGATCTVTNTIFFEGIHTLNPLGLAILSLLMLTLGLLGFRRLGAV